MWLHSSVGRASHWYRGGHEFESLWSPDFFSRFFFPGISSLYVSPSFSAFFSPFRCNVIFTKWKLLSNCLYWKINRDDHSSLSLLFCCFALIKILLFNYRWSLLQIFAVVWHLWTSLWLAAVYRVSVWIKCWKLRDLMWIKRDLTFLSFKVSSP